MAPFDRRGKSGSGWVTGDQKTDVQSKRTQRSPGRPRAQGQNFVSRRTSQSKNTAFPPRGWDGLAERQPTAHLVEEIMMPRAVYRPSWNGRLRIPN